ncbi:MAG: hypothetical protein H8M99_11200 [Gloeobacteraceae cyanobacterium ES-bin-144]|nr:hypothetical protein [Verrucomicrobiales bacterium]
MKIPSILFAAFFTTLPASADFNEMIKRGDASEARFQYDEALKHYLPAEQLKPTDADLLVRISRQYALRMNDLPREADKIASCRKGLEYAERAVAISPNQSDPHLAVAICLGRLAPYLSAKEKIAASRNIKTSAERAIQLNPKNDYAWHILGRWHQSLANIGGTTRVLARVIYNGLPAASNEEAVECFKKAMALKPTRLSHVIELGRTYAMMDRKAESKKYLEQGLAMPNKEKDDPETKQRGRASLKEIS